MPANISKRQSLRHDQGFTLIEIVITIILLGAVAGIMLPFFTAITHSPDPVLRERAISLGQAMMDEIMAKKWDENTPMGGGPICTGESDSQDARPSLIDDCDTSATPVANLKPDGTETRPDYNDVDDYNDLDEPVTGNFRDQNNNAFTLPGYTRQVKVGYIASGTDTIGQTTAFETDNTTDTKLVKVTITSPLGETFYFVAVACNI
jgi:MSHA pilin protein MshD